ncbi:MAG: hypothetical protein Q8755_03445 [Candidatus Phytoplasma australasiaticum]|nr:hypothetical protein [Candidatus Phytoplasma australasiaticum]
MKRMMMKMLNQKNESNNDDYNDGHDGGEGGFGTGHTVEEDTEEDKVDKMPTTFFEVGNQPEKEYMTHEGYNIPHDTPETFGSMAEWFKPHRATPMEFNQYVFIKRSVETNMILSKKLKKRLK